MLSANPPILFAMLQCYVQCYNVANVVSKPANSLCNLQCYNVTMHNVTMLQCYNVTMLQCCTMLPANPAILQETYLQFTNGAIAHFLPIVTYAMLLS